MDILSHKNLYMDVHSSMTHNSQKVEMIINWCTNKLNVMYPYNRTLSSHKKEGSIDICYDVDYPWKSAKWRMAEQKATYYMILFIWSVPNIQIHKDRK